MIQKYLIRELAQVVLAMAATTLAGNWAVGYAYENRGYEAVGGEYLFIPVVFLGVYLGSKWLFVLIRSIEYGALYKREKKEPEGEQHDDKGVRDRC